MKTFGDIDFVNLYLNGTSNSTPPPLVAHQFTEFYGWENYSGGEEVDAEKMYQHFLTKKLSLRIFYLKICDALKILELQSQRMSVTVCDRCAQSRATVVRRGLSYCSQCCRCLSDKNPLEIFLQGSIWGPGGGGGDRV